MLTKLSDEWLCKDLKVKGVSLPPLQISLQHALYLMHHRLLDDASRNLSQAETWRYGDKSASQEVLIHLVQAYKGLLQYHTWSRKRAELSQLGERPSEFPCGDEAESRARRGICSPRWALPTGF